MKHLFVIATGNPGKIRDFAHILGTENKEFKTLKDIGFTDDIVEDGDSFEANAIIKSSTVAKWLCEKHIEASVLADDSGLEVFALNGEPGVLSARYAGEHCTYQDNVNKVLAEMKGETNRKACFKTVVALVLDGETHLFEGRVDGSIIEEPRGTAGFGYDPVFMPDGYNQTFAEMGDEEKNSISHRGRAMRKLIDFLKDRIAEK